MLMLTLLPERANQGARRHIAVTDAQGGASVVAASWCRAAASRATLQSKSHACSELISDS